MYICVPLPLRHTAKSQHAAGLSLLDDETESLVYYLNACRLSVYFYSVVCGRMSEYVMWIVSIVFPFDDDDLDDDIILHTSTGIHLSMKRNPCEEMSAAAEGEENRECVVCIHQSIFTAAAESEIPEYLEAWWLFFRSRFVLASASSALL